MADIDETPSDYGTWLPKPSDEQKQAETEALQRLESSIPVIQDTLDWFDKQIATYKNPLIIEGVNPGTPAETVKTAVLFSQALVTEYKQQRGKFAAEFSQYIKEVPEA
jgi:hypothetical protein